MPRAGRISALHAQSPVESARLLLFLPKIMRAKLPAAAGGTRTGAPRRPAAAWGAHARVRPSGRPYIMRIPMVFPCTLQARRQPARGWPPLRLGNEMEGCRRALGPAHTGGRSRGGVPRGHTAHCTHFLPTLLLARSRANRPPTGAGCAAAPGCCCCCCCAPPGCCCCCCSGPTRPTRSCCRYTSASSSILDLSCRGGGSGGGVGANERDSRVARQNTAARVAAQHICSEKGRTLWARKQAAPLPPHAHKHSAPLSVHEGERSARSAPARRRAARWGRAASRGA